MGRIAFPYLKIVSGPLDLLSYVLLRSLNTRLMRIRPFVRAIERWLPEVTVSPRPLGGTKLCLSTKDASQALILREIFVEDVYDVSKVPFQPDAVVDCGAHVGMFALLAHHRFPTAAFTLFEPNPANVSTLKRTLEINTLDFTVVSSAVSDREGMVTFGTKNSIEGSVLSQDERPNAMHTRYMQVRSTDLAAFILQLRAKQLLLKMDIEGHETVVLPAILGSLPQRTAIFFETHHGWTGWQRLESLLQAQGFATECIRRRDPFVDGFAVRS